ncbi:thermonuclease family protein [Piscinibacter sakaiensis]|uniref:thermonuclease family protein n=1 Tax=Piscinibacter sakaiensis TaxID=1547922 RepID=UPI003AB05BBA
MYPRFSSGSRRRGGHYLATFVSAVMLLAWWLPAAAQGIVVGQVSRVHDGDTLTIAQHDGELLVRLAAIDAPEAEQPFGSASRDSLVGCALGRTAVVEVLGSDRHGRTLGIVFAADQDCGLNQLRKGMAWFYRQYAHEQPSRRRIDYAAAERLARRQRTGLWADDAPLPPAAWRQQNPRFVAPAPR